MTGARGTARLGLGRSAEVVATWLGLCGFVALGTVWAVDRNRHFEPPRWDRDRFVALGAPAAPVAAGTIVVPVNLHCPHCLAGLARIAHARRDRTADPLLVALVVDTPDRPPREAVARLPAEEVWWDRPGVWRRRWGHRIYGEAIHFDSAGLYRFTTPPEVRETAAASRSRPGLDQASRGGIP